MGKYLLLTLFLLIGIRSIGQESNQFYTFRDYKGSMVLELSAERTNMNAYGDYGNLKLHRSEDSRYLFQGQEFEKDLHIYFFPQRSYSSKQKRFAETDPASQYFSPYIFVGGDPVNYFDEDGNMGKPIVFYGEATGKGYHGVKKPWHIRSMHAAGVDAYYLPMNFIAMKSPPYSLPDWNGNVFIQGHTSYLGQVISEQKLESEEDVQFKYRGESDMNKVWEGVEYENEYVIVEPDYLADRLIDYSARNGVPLKNITVDGCQSEAVAGRLSDRLYSRMDEIRQIAYKEKVPESITLRGLKRDRLAFWSDPSFEKHNGVKGPVTDEVRMFAQPAKSRLVFEKDMDGNPTSGRHMIDARGRPVPHIKGKTEFENYTNGRIAKNMQPFYGRYKVFY